jgi:ribonuclease M5
MLKVREVIVVEGRYDKNTVSQAVDATVIETSGFGIFSDTEKTALLKKLAEKRGLIILTDSDSAGFQIRGYLKGLFDSRTVKHAYIPDVKGRERRKSAPSKEGKLGVEGMKSEVIIHALQRAGATFDTASASGASKSGCTGEPITKSDMYDLGLSGRDGSAERRAGLLQKLGLPERLTPNSLLDVLNALFTREEFLTSYAVIQQNPKNQP